jgi:beta-phosphoglucomutase family hydrolase
VPARARPCPPARGLAGAAGEILLRWQTRSPPPSRTRSAWDSRRAITTCLFDLDGVLTQTAKVHAAAWKEMFDGYLRGRADRTGEPFVPFDASADYERYVDGKPRADGTRSFLASRGITIPEGSADDPPTAETVQGLGRRKNDIVQRRIHADGVEVYAGSVTYVRQAVAAGLRIAVVSSSANTREVLQVTGLADLVHIVVDAAVAGAQHLKGKPAPDTFLAGARLVGADPGQAAVFEDALAGVEAGRSGGFGCVVGVDRVGHADALKAHGADMVVADLSELVDSREPRA